MPRRYTIAEPSFAAAANMNLIEIKGAANKIVAVRRWWWKPSDNTLAPAQVIQTRCRLLPATVTDATTGTNTSPSIFANDGGDAAATFTAITKGTVIATTTGTARLYDAAGSHSYNGYDQTIEDPVTVAPSQAFVFEIVGSITATIDIVVGAEVDEIG